MEEQRRVGRTAAELTFWTLCPYCYHAHEYEKAYEECCVRCANCRRGFHAAAIGAPPEHKGAGGGGYYDCRLGLFPLRYDWSAREEEWTGEVEDYLVEDGWESEGNAGHVNAGAEEEEGDGMESCGGELEFEYEGDDILVSARLMGFSCENGGSVQRGQKVKTATNEGATREPAPQVPGAQPEPPRVEKN